MLDWLPRAEQKLEFRVIPDSEHDLVQFMDSHNVCLAVINALLTLQVRQLSAVFVQTMRMPGI